jgi:hypothetical protein
MKAEVISGGYDIASISSGLTFVRGIWNDDDSVTIEPLTERAFKIENNFLSRYENALEMLRVSRAVQREYGHLDVCAIEDYIMAVYSMVSYSTGEFSGIVRAFHYAAGFPILLNKPQIMKSFLANGRKVPKGAALKRALVDWVGEDFGYVSCQRLVKERSDCADAAAHAIIGAYTLLFERGAPYEILSPKRKEIWTNSKKNGIFDAPEHRLYRPKTKEGTRVKAN